MGGRQRARGNVMRPAEGRKEVVERLFVHQVDNRELGAPLIPVAVKNVVKPHGEVNKLRG